MAPVFRPSPAPRRGEATGEPLHWTPTNNYSSLAYHPIVRYFLRGERLAARDISFRRPGCPSSGEVGALSFASQPYDWFALVENDDATGSICKNRREVPERARSEWEKS